MGGGIPKIVPVEIKVVFLTHINAPSLESTSPGVFSSI